LANELLDHLAFVCCLKLRLRDLLHVFDWEPVRDGLRQCLYGTRQYLHDGAPFEALQQRLLDTVGTLQTQPLNSRLRRALKWFSNGVAARYQDDQFAYFWFVIELVAQIIKEPTRVPDKCPNCRGPLYCEQCKTTPLHRPYPKQAIQELFLKYGPTDADKFYRDAADARNMLMHGTDVPTIEVDLNVEFSQLTDQMGRLAWTAIANQFIPAMVGKNPSFLRPSTFSSLHLTAYANMEVGYDPDFDNPDPANFPKIEFSVTDGDGA